MSLRIIPSRFIHAVACVRIYFVFRLKNIPLCGWMTFCFSIHPSLDTCNIYINFSCHNICGITSESPMNRKSHPSNFFLKLFILKNSKLKKKGGMHVNFTCVQELTLYDTSPCVWTVCMECVLCVHSCVWEHMLVCAGHMCAMHCVHAHSCASVCVFVLCMCIC